MYFLRSSTWLIPHYSQAAPSLVRDRGQCPSPSLETIHKICPQECISELWEMLTHTGTMGWRLKSSFSKSERECAHNSSTGHFIKHKNNYFHNFLTIIFQLITKLVPAQCSWPCTQSTLTWEATGWLQETEPYLPLFPTDLCSISTHAQKKITWLTLLF